MHFVSLRFCGIDCLLQAQVRLPPGSVCFWESTPRGAMCPCVSRIHLRRLRRASVSSLIALSAPSLFFFGTLDSYRQRTRMKHWEFQVRIAFTTHCAARSSGSQTTTQSAALTYASLSTDGSAVSPATVYKLCRPNGCRLPELNSSIQVRCPDVSK